MALTHGVWRCLWLDLSFERGEPDKSALIGGNQCDYCDLTVLFAGRYIYDQCGGVCLFRTPLPAHLGRRCAEESSPLVFCVWSFALGGWKREAFSAMSAEPPEWMVNSHA